MNMEKKMAGHAANQEFSEAELEMVSGGTSQETGMDMAYKKFYERVGVKKLIGYTDERHNVYLYNNHKFGSREALHEALEKDGQVPRVFKHYAGPMGVGRIITSYE